MTTTDREIVITRMLDAPRELAWTAMIDPKHIVHWWGPRGFTTTIQEMDVRPGGVWTHVMHGPDGTRYRCHGVYQEIVPAERLVFTNVATDAAGKAVLDGMTTVTFAEQNGKTKLTVRTGGIALVDYATAYLEGMEIGWTQSLERRDAEVAALG